MYHVQHGANAVCATHGQNAERQKNGASLLESLRSARGTATKAIIPMYDAWFGISSSNELKVPAMSRETIPSRLHMGAEGQVSQARDSSSETIRRWAPVGQPQLRD